LYVVVCGYVKWAGPITRFCALASAAARNQPLTDWSLTGF
jgi:hypothetical protein